MKSNTAIKLLNKVYANGLTIHNQLNAELNKEGLGQPSNYKALMRVAEDNQEEFNKVKQMLTDQNLQIKFDFAKGEYFIANGKAPDTEKFRIRITKSHVTYVEVDARTEEDAKALALAGLTDTTPDEKVRAASICCAG